MISITQVAAEKIRMAATESGPEAPVLRIAAKLAGDGSIEFGMGFDQSRPGDVTVEVEGIVIVIAPQSSELVEGVQVDFVEVEPGDLRFIFAHPGEADGD